MAVNACQTSGDAHKHKYVHNQDNLSLLHTRRDFLLKPAILDVLMVVELEFNLLLGTNLNSVQRQSKYTRCRERNNASVK